MRQQSPVFDAIKALKPLLAFDATDVACMARAHTGVFPILIPHAMDMGVMLAPYRVLKVVFYNCGQSKLLYSGFVARDPLLTVPMLRLRGQEEFLLESGQGVEQWFLLRAAGLPIGTYTSEIAFHYTWDSGQESLVLPVTFSVKANDGVDYDIYPRFVSFKATEKQMSLECTNFTDRHLSLIVEHRGFQCEKGDRQLELPARKIALLNYNAKALATHLRGSRMEVAFGEKHGNIVKIVPFLCSEGSVSGEVVSRDEVSERQLVSVTFL